MVTTIYLVRHAEADGNVKEFYQGGTDTQITEKGRRQLAHLAERFRNVPLDAVYASPYARAVATAEAVNLHHKLPIIRESELRELCGGLWEKMPWAEIPKHFPAEHLLWTTQMQDFCAPEGDRMTDVYARMQAALTRIAEANAGKTVAVVSHGCALRNFLCFVEFNDITRLSDVGWADNTAVSCVTYDPEKGFSLVRKNDSSHLPPECSTIAGSKWCRYETAKEAAT